MTAKSEPTLPNRFRRRHAGPSQALACAAAWVPLLLALPAAVALAAGDDDNDPQAFHQHAATCVAVMKPQASALAERYRGGDAKVEPELLGLTEAGFMFIGVAYKSGLRKPEADRLLVDAERRQQSAAAAELARLFTDCRAEGERLLTDANVLERALVSQQARARLRKLTADPDKR